MPLFWDCFFHVKCREEGFQLSQERIATCFRALVNRLKAGELDLLLSRTLILKHRHKTFERSQTYILQACIALRAVLLVWQMVPGGLVLCPCDGSPGAPSTVLSITTLLSLTHELPALQLPGIDSFCWQGQGQEPYCHNQRASICWIEKVMFNNEIQL